MITIVGAGLVGSLWALLLRQQGYEVQVFERRADPRRENADGGRSINLVITSRGLYALEQAGLLKKATALAVPVYGRMIHPKSGDCMYQAYGQEKECNLSISRGALNQFLIDEAEKAGAKIYFSHELKNLDAQKKTLSFSTPQGEETKSYEILFGADGAGSRVRKALAQVFAGSWEERTDWLEADYKELTLPLAADGKPQLRTNALHIWPRGAHMMMALANRDGSFTMTVYLPKEKAPRSFDKLKTSADIEEFFKSEFPDALPLMPRYLEEFTGHPQGTLGTVRASKWVFADSIALMGDAAHGIVPFFGQGMNSGFEDCTKLLDLLKNHRDQWPAILSRYEAQQKPNADAIADMALENWVEMRDKVGDSRFLLRKKIESTLEQKNPGLFKSRYGMITYTLVPYALAQKAGLKQNHIVDQLMAGVSSLEEVSWEKAERLIQSEWKPFVQKEHLDVTPYLPEL
jgi:kynurenine 3-monooxygenase